MITQQFRVAGEPVTINTLETESDIPALRSWFQEHGHQLIAADTETTGLNPYAEGFRLRHVQFGDRYTAWVLPADRFLTVITAILLHPGYRFVFHNTPFDMLVLQALGVLDANELARRTLDTQLYCHLVDPRDRKSGGIGMKLKDNAAHYVDPKAPDTQTGLNHVFKSIDVTSDGKVWDLSQMDTKTKAKLRKRLREEGRSPRTIKVDEGWRYVPLFHPTYILYAGLDVILTCRLYDVLSPIVSAKEMDSLADFEHQLQRVCLKMQIRALQANVPHLESLSDYFAGVAIQHEDIAARYGVESIGSPKQVVAGLLEMGETLTKKTKKGAFSADKSVLYALADLNEEDDLRNNFREPNPLAAAILGARRAEKWRSAYVLNMLNLRDRDDRIHAGIRSLQARTARMSVSNPPFQQLPASDWMIRTGIRAKDGYAIVSSDYSQIEMRVAAAFAGEQKMIDAALQGVSQHVLTANQLFGDGWSKSGKEYKIAKNVGFGSVYGGGATTLSRQAGISFERAQEVVAMFRDTYPSLTDYKRQRNWDVLDEVFTPKEMTHFRQLQRAFFDAEDQKSKDKAKEAMNDFCGNRAAWIRTPIGRVLPVEASKAYKVVNFEVQSTSRDVLAAALLRLDKTDLSDYLVMPIHDEVLAEAPVGIAEDVAKSLEEVMTSEFRGVPLTAEGEVYGPTWGCGYTAGKERTPALLKAHGSCCLGTEALSNAA